MYNEAIFDLQLKKEKKIYFKIEYSRYFIGYRPFKLLKLIYFQRWCPVYLIITKI